MTENRKDILRLAGILNENDYSNVLAEKYARITGAYQSMTKTVRDHLEPAIRQLENPEWNREEDSMMMLDHLEKAVRETLKEMNRIQPKIDELLHKPN